jgi:DNA-directed RNA polymerase subunit RPC12/RpoP
MSRVSNGTRKRVDGESGRDCANCNNPISIDNNMGYGIASHEGSLCQNCASKILHGEGEASK